MLSHLAEACFSCNPFIAVGIITVACHSSAPGCCYFRTRQLVEWKMVELENYYPHFKLLQVSNQQMSDFLSENGWGYDSDYLTIRPLNHSTRSVLKERGEPFEEIVRSVISSLRQSHPVSPRPQSHRHRLPLRVQGL